ncbi:MAG: hypothetical protein LBR15_03690 [Methanobrevibacter sp.]|jgi:hypothetical protein|nr:hypothetical protein [Candidatus Methanovirga australis]
MITNYNPNQQYYQDQYSNQQYYGYDQQPKYKKPKPQFNSPKEALKNEYMRLAHKFMRMSMQYMILAQRLDDVDQYTCRDITTHDALNREITNTRGLFDLAKKAGGALWGGIKTVGSAIKQGVSPILNKIDFKKIKNKSMVDGNMSIFADLETWGNISLIFAMVVAIIVIIGIVFIGAIIYCLYRCICVRNVEISYKGNNPMDNYS